MPKKNYPKLRFKGFTNAWEQRELGDVADVFDGTHQTPDYKSEGIPFFSVENINNLKTKKFISETDFKRDFKNPPVKGDILMTRIGDIGTARVVNTDGPLAYYVSLALIRPKDSDANFLTQFISSPCGQNELWKRTLHIAFPQKINKSEISQIILSVPLKYEQTKIGTFFKKIDDLIAANQRKLDKLKLLKKGYLQQIFEQKLRFKGYAEPWEKRKLREVTNNNYAGGTPSTKINEYWINGDIRWMSSGEVNLKYVHEVNGRITRLGLNNSSAKIVPMHSVLIALAGQGKTRGTVAVNEVELATNQSVAAIVPSNNLDYLFLFQNLDSRYEELRLISSGDGTRGGLNLKLINDLMIRMPKLCEQQKIGNFFNNLDKLIFSQQLKIEKLKKLKKAYLQQMFI